MHTAEVPVEALTHDWFREFGQIIGELDEPPAWRRPRLTSWRMRFEMDGGREAREQDRCAPRPPAPGRS